MRRRVAALLAALAVAAGLGVAAAPAASACASQPCQWYCDLWETTGRSCPIR